MARAEARKRDLEAERLATEAKDRSDSASAVRAQRDEHLRLADLRDPDVRTDDDGYRIDEEGNRLDADRVGEQGPDASTRADTHDVDRADRLDERSTDDRDLRDERETDLRDPGDEDHGDTPRRN
jgi:hypothetical protein